MLCLIQIEAATYIFDVVTGSKYVSEQIFIPKKGALHNLIATRKNSDRYGEDISTQV